MRNRLLYLLITISGTLSSSLTTLAVEGVAEKRRPVSVGLVVGRSFEFHKSPLAALLEAKLSQREDIQLLERAQIDKILQEQKLSLAGLLERNTAVRVGRLIRADALLLLSIENHQGNKQSEKALLRIRLVETAHGLRLLDSFEQSDNTKLEEAAARIAENMAATACKLRLPFGQAIPVGVVDIHRVQLGNRHQRLARVLPKMLSARLSKEPRIIMLEREDLSVLRDEKLLTEGQDSEFWSSAVLIDGHLQRKGTKNIQMRLRLRRAFGEDVADLAVLVEPNDPRAVANRVATDIIQELLNTPPTASWHPEQEAVEFFRQGRLLYEHQRFDAAADPLETAHALQPDNLLYAATLFENAWIQRLSKEWRWQRETGPAVCSDLELAETVSLLVRQIRAGYEKGLLSAGEIYRQWSRHLGNDWGPGGYFGNSVSVATEEIRLINRENRRVWVRTMDEALKKALGREIVDKTPLIRPRFAWVSSDVPEELMANIRETYGEFILPPELGGQETSVDTRSHHCPQLLRYEMSIRDHRAFSSTHLNGSGERFWELWLEYLQELADMSDPVVSFHGCIALAQHYECKNSGAPEAKEYCHRALEILKTELKTPNEPLMEDTKSLLRQDMKYCLRTTHIEHGKVVSILEELWEPLIEAYDVNNLIQWNLRPGLFNADYFSHPEALDAARRYMSLLSRVIKVIETAKDRKNVGTSLNRIKDFYGELLREFPQLEASAVPVEMSVTMLLSKDDWSRDRGYSSRLSFGSFKAVIQDNILWVALRESYAQDSLVRLAGIDLTTRQLIASCQGRIAPHGKISGLVVAENTIYVAVNGAGLIEFPRTSGMEKAILKNLKLLTPEDGLASVYVTSIARYGDNLWVAYGGAGKESGLGIYDPHTGGWETVFCSALKGESAFNSGQTYLLTDLSPAPLDTLFFIVTEFHGDKGHIIWRRARLCRLDTNTRQLTELLQDENCTLFHPQMSPRILSIGDKWWCQAAHFLTQLKPNSQTLTFVLGSRRASEFLATARGTSIELCPDLFVSESFAKKFSYGRYVGGWTDLSTCAVHRNRLWARLGKSQLAIIERGKNAEEAQIIENNILNGGKVLEFLSTPYGLIAIGEGTVGLIETENNEK